VVKVMRRENRASMLARLVALMLLLLPPLPSAARRQQARPRTRQPHGACIGGDGVPLDAGARAPSVPKHCPPDRWSRHSRAALPAAVTLVYVCWM